MATGLKNVKGYSKKIPAVKNIFPKSFIPWDLIQNQHLIIPSRNLRVLLLVNSEQPLVKKRPIGSLRTFLSLEKRVESY